jgi:hypothetical protein
LREGKSADHEGERNREDCRPEHRSSRYVSYARLSLPLASGFWSRPPSDPDLLALDLALDRDATQNPSTSAIACFRQKRRDHVGGRKLGRQACLHTSQGHPN